MLGRRGPAQAAFTTPELNELGELAGADVVVDPADLELDAAASRLEATRTRERNLEMLREYAARAPAGKPTPLVLRFLTSPVALLGDERVEAVELVRNRLEPDEQGQLARRRDGRARDAPVRARLPQRRLPGRRRCRASRSTSAARRS